MNNGVATVCDACFKPLDGINGTEKVKKQYLSIRGTICLKTYDINRIEHYTWGNPNKEEALRTFLHFCNGKCLDDYMAMRVTLKAEYHQNKGLEPVNYLDPDKIES